MLRLSRKPCPERTVRQDWHAELSAEKSQVYMDVLGEVQSAHVIYSIALNEALALRKWGRVSLAREQVSISADLCERFAGSLENLLDGLERHAQHFGTLPTVAPLDPACFLGETAGKAAAINSLLSTVLFGQQSRFLHKVRTLGEMTSDLSAEYRVWAMAVCEGSGASAAENWEQLGTLQFDLTSSLGEATIMLKSFLLELPGKEVASLRDRLKASLSAAPAVPDRCAAARRG